MEPSGTQQDVKTAIISSNEHNRQRAFVQIASGVNCCCNACSGFVYGKESIDARCCGACHYCCPSKYKEEQCYVCPVDFNEYWNSGYVQTHDGYGDTSDCCCFCVWLPIKLPLFSVCFLGSLLNNCINWTRGTNLNYLF
jgi:hypothetical protein